MNDLQHIIAETIEIDQRLVLFLDKVAGALRGGFITSAAAADLLQETAEAIRNSIARRGELTE